MKFCGIICEFNPFHNGHQYIIEKAKELSGSDIICLMSGNFVQRGTPAFQEKYIRAKNAIEAGASAVLELPTIYACSNAENFAFGAIKIFKALGVSEIAFGIENTDLETLQKVAELKAQNSLTFQNAFRNEIENGINFNTALKHSIAKTLGDETILDTLSKPNNILAIEYLSAIIKQHAKITPIAINRVDNGYYCETQKGQYLSATAIRNLVINNQNFESYIPEYCKFSHFFDENCEKKYETAVLLNLRNHKPESLEKFYDYNEGIEYRIKKFSDEETSLESISNSVATPRYRKQRVNKLLIYPILGITKAVIASSKTAKPVAKLLAISKSRKEILSSFNKTKINLICTNKDYNSLSKKQSQIIDIDLNASNLYSAVIGQKNNNDKKVGTMFI